MTLDIETGYETYLAHGGRLSQVDHEVLRRRTSQTGRLYNSRELKGLERAKAVAQRHGFSISLKVAAAYHHLTESFGNHFRGDNLTTDETLVLRDALAMVGDSASVAKTH